MSPIVTFKTKDIFSFFGKRGISAATSQMAIKYFEIVFYANMF